MKSRLSRILSVCLVMGAGSAAAAASFSVLNSKSVSLARNEEPQKSPATAPAHSAAPPFPGFWESLHVHGDEAEGYKTLSEMAESADHVVLGTLTNFRLNRQIQTGSAEYVIQMGAADLQVTRVVRGENPGKVVVLEFLLTGPPEHMATKIRQQAETMPAGPALFFLRHKGGKEAGLYRIVNSRGLWISDGDKLTAPLAGVVGAVARPTIARTFSEREIAQELAARPKHLRQKPRAANNQPESADEESADEPEAESTPYQEELTGVRTLDDLANLVDGVP